MKCALTSVAPAFLSAGLLTALFAPAHRIWLCSGSRFTASACWRTQHFAPRSIVVLGLTFFLTGCGLLVTWKHLFMPNPHVEPSALVVSGIMAATFGGFHLAYAAAVWALGEGEESVPSTTGTENV